MFKLTETVKHIVDETCDVNSKAEVSSFNLSKKETSNNFNPDQRATPVKSIEKNHKKEENVLDDIERGKEMTFTEADSGSVNPNFEESDGFQCNCQTCVVVFEARLRGWNIEAKPYTEGSNLEKLSENTSLAWIDSEGKHPQYVYNLEANSTDAMYDFISETVKPGQRYTMQGIWKGPWGCGHIISVFREETGNLVFYDPQINKIYNERGIKENVLSMMKKGTTEEETIKLLRVDNLSFDKDIVSSIVRKSETYV